ncbi:MAG: SGNH/GDSL hydrolase family protein [Planctomycetes bacterium]|nr:SGNH/GDSL hydrolase family protein [Planctomycetota bacterium]
MTTLLAALTLALLPILPAQAPAAPKSEPPKGEAPAPALTDRIVFLGASMTEGFGVEGEIGAPIWMGDVLRAGLRRDLPPPNRGSNLLFFADPKGIGTKTAADALAKEPTLVVALDYLFWFGYGEFAAPELRSESFELGLKQLAPFRCPILVGDLPDMQAALQGKPQMLQAKQLPDPATLTALNERLRAWAKERPNVVLFPLAELNGKLRAGKEITLHGNTIFASELPDLFQSDLLHPTAMGTIVVWIAAADALVRARRDCPSSWFEWDRQQIYRKLYSSQEPARKKKLLDKQKEFERKNPAPPPPPPPDPAELERKQRGGG